MAVNVTAETAGGVADGSDGIEVRKDDQLKICAFGVNTNRLLELKRSREELQKELDGIEDAEQEMMLAEGDVVGEDDNEPFLAKVGGVFVRMNEDELNDYLEKQKEKLEEEVLVLDQSILALEKTQAELKEELYKKFGDQINLEY